LGVDVGVAREKSDAVLSIRKQKIMKKRANVFAAVLLMLATTAVTQADQETGKRSTWRIEMANDLLFSSDNQFTNGFYLQKHGPVASSLGETTGAAAIGKRLARLFLPTNDALNYREGWSVGQNMQTPELIGTPDVILNDVPYLGLLGWSNSFVAFDDQRMTGFGWMIGIVGPSSFAEEAQKGVHKVIGSDEPLGWDNQLDDEPVLSLFYTKKSKLWRKPNFDGAVAFNGAASNFMSFGEVAMEMRVGRMPGGFTYIPDPLGRGLNFDASIPNAGRTAIYGSLVVRATRFLVAMPREGNNFTDSNEWTENNVLEPKDFIGQIFLGFNYERPTWAGRFTLWYGTDSVETDSLAEGQDPENRGGTLTIEWKI
jgi:lipid A 3-O-deacylase